MTLAVGTAARAAELAQVQASLKLGDPEKAIAECIRILAGDPDDAQVLRLLGLAYLQKCNTQAAEIALTRALKSAPADSAVLNALGVVRMQQHGYADAVRLFTQCLDIEPGHCDALGNLASLFTALKQPHQAEPYLIQLTRMRPDSADVHARTCDNQLALNAVNAAVRHGRKAIRLSPGFISGRLSLADALEAAGKFKQAKLQYLTILRDEATNAAALTQLLSLRGVLIPREYVSKAEAVLASSPMPVPDRIKLHLALAQHYDEQGEYERAFGHAELGNTLRHDSRPFDSASFTADVDRLIAVGRGTAAQAKSLCEARGLRPIFIVGMPRSGTTLVEQVLASHSKVAAGGELPTIMNIVAELNRGKPAYPEVLVTLNETDLTRLAQQYLAKLLAVAASPRYITDKMPFNFMHLALIASMFPTASIIHCRREPLDTCLSCYFTGFNERLAFASNLESLGRYWLDYQRLMQHWHATLSVKILDVRYEELVTRTEETVRGLLGHCGLNWEDQCLSFHKTSRGIRTPSRWQVRQPVYRSSLRRWQNYERHLSPLAAVLAPSLAEEETRLPS